MEEDEWKWDERAFCKEQKKRETARERTQEPLKNQLKGGEFKGSGMKRSGRKRKEEKCEVQKEELVDAKKGLSVSSRRRGKKKM